MNKEIKEAAELYKEKFGVMPVDDGYLFAEDLGDEICFATSERVLEAYGKGCEYQEKTIRYMGRYLFLITVIFWVAVVVCFVFGWRSASAILFLEAVVLLCGSLYERWCKKGYLQQKKIWQNNIVIYCGSVIKM